MQEIETAYHEAGHAVMGCLLKRFPLSVTVVPRGQVIGETFFESEVPDYAYSYLNDSPDKRRYAEQRILTELAGSAAHSILMPDRQHDRADSNDLYFTQQLIVELVSWEEDREAHLLAAQVQASDLLRKNWEWVEAVAKALCEKKTLQREDILKLRPPSARAVI